ncbi:MAG: copper amine oxidase N-terminal domain-containing protein [Caldiserica bacterium]|nr:copper amine oxidase N-terminal domain-containing protein [Caldisericota bacterium]
MKRILIISTALTLLVLPWTNIEKTIAQDLQILDRELFLVTPGQVIDWKFQINPPQKSIVKGKLEFDSTTQDPVWAVQGCIGGYCFMDEGGPQKETTNSQLDCQIRLYVPSDFTGDDKQALVTMVIYADNTEFGTAMLHLMSVKPQKANFVAGEKPIRITEIKLENCVPTKNVSERTIISKAAPTIVKGSMMIPFRVLGEIIGAEVGWNSNTNEASYVIGSKKIVLRKDIAKARIIFTGFEKSIQVNPPPTNIQGNIMVPLRFVTNALGGQVNWDEPTKTATIQFPGCNTK